VGKDQTLMRLSPQVICEKADKTDIPTIDKKKYLVPSVSLYSQHSFLRPLCIV